MADPAAAGWSADYFQQVGLDELADEGWTRIGEPTGHPWEGPGLRPFGCFRTQVLQMSTLSMMCEFQTLSRAHMLFWYFVILGRTLV